jgi:hypothetical protein
MKKKIRAVVESRSQKRMKRISGPYSRKRPRQTSVIRKLGKKKFP